MTCKAHTKPHALKEAVLGADMRVPKSLVYSERAREREERERERERPEGGL